MTTGRGNPRPSLSDLDSVDDRAPEIGEANGDSAGDALSDEDVYQMARDRGLEVHRPRRPRRVIDRSNDVKNKKRLTIHLPTELRLALEPAKFEMDRSHAMIVEEALIDWFKKYNFRLPDFETTWDK